MRNALTRVIQVQESGYAIENAVYKAEQLNVAMLVELMRKFGRAIEAQVHNCTYTEQVT